MLERTVVVQNPEGLHARPAARLVQAASRFTSQVELAANGKTVSAKSIVAVLRLGVRQGESITIRASGDDERLAVDDLARLVSDQVVGSGSQ